jgi:spore maturation protein A
MMNHVWIFLIVAGVIVALGASMIDAMKADTLEARLTALKEIGTAVTASSFDMSKTAVTIAIEYIGLMALWLGIMKIAEEAGIVSFLARVVRPVMRRLFPRVPADHPAMGAMLMNIAANMLGLDNAATPLGLKAMKELQTLNKEPDTATDPMIMFLAINTSSVTLIPFTVIAFRSTAGSANPQAILAPALIATTLSTIGGITAAYLMSRFSRNAVGNAGGERSKQLDAPAKQGDT